MEQEWLAINRALKNYMEHPEEHTATIFLRCPLQSDETINRLREEKGIILDARMKSFYQVRRIPGNPHDVLAKKPE